MIKEKLKKAGGFMADKFWEGIILFVGIFFLLAYKISGESDYHD